MPRKAVRIEAAFRAKRKYEANQIAKTKPGTRKRKLALENAARRMLKDAAAIR